MDKEKTVEDYLNEEKTYIEYFFEGLGYSKQDLLEEYKSKAAVKVANFIINNIMRDVVFDGLDVTFPISADQTAELLELKDNNIISDRQIKDVYNNIIWTSEMPSDAVKRLNISQLDNIDELKIICKDIVSKNTKQVEEYRAGNSKLFNFFIGQAMKATKGSAKIDLINEIMKQLLKS